MQNMKDVARLAGVSIATVSAVINGTAKVSPRLTERVKRAMVALDYQPDQVARSLKLGKTSVVGMIIPDITNVFYPGVTQGVEAVARENGYSVILCNSNEDPKQEEQLLTTLVARRVDGVVLASADPTEARHWLRRQRVPIVFLDRRPTGSAGQVVSTDNVGAAQLAIRHLIDLGHERIAIVAGPQRLSPLFDRLEGFRKEMGKAHLAIRSEYVKECTLRLGEGYAQTMDLLRLREPPTAIFATNNKLVLTVIRAVLELGLAIPRDISVVAIDDFPGAEYFRPALTVVAQQMYELGSTAMQRLLEMMKGEVGGRAIEAKTVLLKAKLIVRDSTAPPLGHALHAVPLVSSAS